jgi:hypothetical protein
MITPSLDHKLFNKDKKNKKMIRDSRTIKGLNEKCLAIDKTLDIYNVSVAQPFSIIIL